jgi:hypothetical protein
MTHSTRPTDLFAAQPGLFDHVPPPSATPDPAKVRARLLDWLATARAAQRMPWDAQQERKYATLFHQMANWLPEEERDRLRAEFASHLDRLRVAG